MRSGQPYPGYETNKNFASESAIFRNACKAADVEPTKRQASKYRRRKGKAYAYFRDHVRPQLLAKKRA